MPSLRDALRVPWTRRAVTVPAVAAGAAALATTPAFWAPLAGISDLVRGRPQLPRVRLLAFAQAWTALEAVGVGAAAALWAIGRADDAPRHYWLQQWWADRMVDALSLTGGLRFEAEGLEHLRPGPLVMATRHASIADALVPVWLLGRVGMRVRYVLKRELLLDPCLDIVGNRLPNCFVEREPAPGSDELRRVAALSAGMGPLDGAVIYPEGGVFDAAGRVRVVERIAAQDPERARRVARLRSLAPVRPGGTFAMLEGNPAADLVVVAHHGFEPLARVAAAADALPLTTPVRVSVRRIPRSEIPPGDGFVRWFDDVWQEADERVAELAGRGPGSPRASMTS
jgi:1-acyl-sn-glycerol-3-phosphate acyltransferase